MLPRNCSEKDLHIQYILGRFVVPITISISMAIIAGLLVYGLILLNQIKTILESM